MYRTSRNIVNFYQPKNGQNKDKLVIILDLPDVHMSGSVYGCYNEVFNHFEASKVPTLIIGNKRQSLTYKLIEDAVKNVKLPENILIVVDGHGFIDKDGDHEIAFDNTSYKAKTKDLFNALKAIFKEKPINVLLTSCLGGGAVKDVDFLPKGSKLLVLSAADKTVHNNEAMAIFADPINYQEQPNKFSLNYFLEKYLFALGKTNNIPTLVVSGANKEFDYTKFSQYLGRKLEDTQKNKTIAILKDYCDQSGCLNNLNQAFNKIENSKDFNDLKESETLSKVYMKEYLYPLCLKRNFEQEPYIINIDNIEKELEAAFKLESDTNYGICESIGEEKDIPANIIESCKTNPPPEPTFGYAMAILYELYKRDAGESS